MFKFACDFWPNLFPKGCLLGYNISVGRFAAVRTFRTVCPLATLSAAARGRTLTPAGGFLHTRTIHLALIQSGGHLYTIYFY